MRRTVALIIGTSYCGSSLLNLLLDAQPGIRGLGEAVHLLGDNGTAHCGLCAKPVPECPVRAVVDPDRFYGSLFDYYRDCEVLIDSSKSVQASVGVHPFEWDLEYRVLLLSKAPHEFAWSYIHHHESESPRTAFQRYLDFYSEQLEFLFDQCWFRPWRCLRLTYRQLALHMEATRRRILHFLGGDGEPADLAWRTDTHIIGGNWMVAAQLRDSPQLFADNLSYLRGKYSGRYHTIFYDDQWRTDKKFIHICLQLYHRRRQDLEPLLGDLRQLDFAQQIVDLSSVLSPKPIGNGECPIP